MDYVEGASLSELRKELAAAGRAVDSGSRCGIVLDALAGLHARPRAARRERQAPRDHPPRRSPSQRPRRLRRARALTDFGIAKAEDRVQMTRTHEVKGKLAYLAPERIDKRRICTVQSDVFSMAVVLWECIAGRRLFRGEEAVDTLQEVMSAPIPTLRQLGAHIPPELDDVIARGLSRDLDTRYLNAKDFAEAIERAAGAATWDHAEDVARVIEAVFGSRMRSRHAKIRAAMQGRDDVEHSCRSPASERPPAGRRRAEDRVRGESWRPSPPRRLAVATRLRRTRAPFSRYGGGSRRGSFSRASEWGC